MKANPQYDARGWRTDGCMSDEYRSLCKYPRRQAVKYSRGESRDIQEQHALGFDNEEIAEWHERTANGVYVHLERLGAYVKRSS